MKRIPVCPSLAVLLLLHVAVLRAEQACPPGQYQASPRGMPGAVICAPIPRDQQGRPVPVPVAATHWGVIALDAAHARVGAVVDLPNKQAAERSALGQCHEQGGTQCSIAIAYGDGCAALATSGHGNHTAADVTLDHARQSALAACAGAGGRDCHVTYAGCSPSR